MKKLLTISLVPIFATPAAIAFGGVPEIQLLMKISMNTKLNRLIIYKAFTYRLVYGMPLNNSGQPGTLNTMDELPFEVPFQQGRAT